MQDLVTLDQLRVFAIVVGEGSFSAAARKLRRVQSAVSTSMANLENQLGLALWDRSTKIASLTPQGQALLVAAKRVLSEVDSLHQLAKNMQQGLEAHVSLCVDSLFPLDALVELCSDFAKQFPSVDLRVDTQTMSDVSRKVLGDLASLGIVSPLGVLPGLERRALTFIRMVPVVAPNHPLAAISGTISSDQLSQYIQIVLSERQEGVPDQGVLSPRTWRVAELHTKHAMLTAGLGWGNLPEHLIVDDLKNGRLVTIQPVAWGEDEHRLYLSVIYKKNHAFGPAHHWILSRLAVLCQSTSETKPV